MPADDVRQRLRDLPTERQPPYDWAEFRRREHERRWLRRNPVKWEHAAVVAGITVLIASMAMWGRSDHNQMVVASSGMAAAPAAASVEPQSFDPATDNAAMNDAFNAANEQFNAAARQRMQAASIAAQAVVAAQLAALRRTQDSREWLEQQPAEPAVVRVGPRVAVANLEDRIAWVDDALTDARFGSPPSGSVNNGRMRALEQERARLVSSLARVRYAQTLASASP